MASRHNDQVHLSGNHGRSKAQMCLKRILDFISSHSPEKSHEMRIESGFGNGIDLNLRLGGGGSSRGDLEYESKEVVSACSGVGEEKSHQRECDVQREPLQEEEESSSSEITHLQEMEINPAPPEQQTEDEEHSNKVKNGKRKATEEESKSKSKGKGFLDLLVEAARLVSGGLQDDDGPTLKQLSQAGRLSECNTVEAVPPLELKADTNWFDCCGGIEVDMSPLVRSKRGRNQVLPSRFRDSVLEPLTTRVTSTPKSSRLTAAKPKSRKRR